MSDVGSRLRWLVRPAPRLLLPLLLVSLALGCKGFDNPFGSNSNDDDPFLPGGRIPQTGATPPQQQPQPPAPTTPSAGQPTNPTPPSTPAWSPAPGATPTGNTTAGLTSTGARPIDPASDPRSSGPATGPGPDTKGWTPSPGTASGATLRGPDTTPGSSVTQVGGPQRIDTIDQAMNLLKSYGMDYYRLNEVFASKDAYFQCHIPTRDQPNVGKIYEAHGTDAVDAMRKVIDEINSARQPGG